MTEQGHKSLHSFVPFYAGIKAIKNASVDGIKDGNRDRFIDIKNVADDMLSKLIDLEKDFLSNNYKRRACEKEKI